MTTTIKKDEKNDNNIVVKKVVNKKKIFYFLSSTTVLQIPKKVLDYCEFLDVNQLVDNNELTNDIKIIPDEYYSINFFVNKKENEITIKIKKVDFYGK